jgi:6-phosphogluconolactonase/glucosamine-6-phosphate isomerase/deaminase
MEYVRSEDYKEGALDLANAIAFSLKENKKVLWILTGGSSIPSCVEAFDLIKKMDVSLEYLTVTLTDERYGEVGYTDSSWQKLIEAGFDFNTINPIPVLTGLPFEETATDFEININKAFAENDIIISQFGIGADLHIAGILPKSPGTLETRLVSAYTSDPFQRITLSFEAIRKIQKAFVFIFGESKKGAISELKESVDSLSEKPANILKEIEEVFVYSDQIS